MPDLPDRYPGYDVLDKRDTVSWNDITRRVIDERLNLPRTPRAFTEHEYATVEAIAARLVPQPAGRDPIPVAALVDHKLHTGRHDGFRHAGMPREREAWQRGIAALDAEARAAYSAAFRELSGEQQDALLHDCEAGNLHNEAWGDMPPKLFFNQRMARDIVFAYYAHPTSWSEIGFGGPASPRGYVRLGDNAGDPWEAAEASPGERENARRINRRVG